MDHLQDQDRLSKLYEKTLDGEYVICDKCDGTGWEISPDFKFPCKKCWGVGILDWIENIMGKECPFTESGMSSSSSSSSSSNNGLPTQQDVKDYLDFVEENQRRYIENMKGKTYELNNSFRSRTVQRLHQMSDKLKRCMQRRGH